MQNQAQIAAQNAHVTQLLMNGAAISQKGMTSRRKSWHSDSDLNLRREVFSHIARLIQKHNLESKLPALARELEGALYSSADSKEEYGNLITLERRICTLMLHWRNRQKAAQFAVLPTSHVSEVPPHSGGYPGFTLLPGSNFQSSGTGRILSNHTGPRVLMNSGSVSTNPSNDVGGVRQVSGLSHNALASPLGPAPLQGFNVADKSYQDQVRYLMRGSGLSPGISGQFPGFRCGAGVARDGTHGSNPAEFSFENPNMKMGITAGITNPNSLMQTPGNSFPMGSTEMDLKLPHSYFSQHMSNIQRQSFPAQDMSHAGASPNSPTISVVSQEQQHPGRSILASSEQSSKEFDPNLVNAKSQCVLRDPLEQDTIADALLIDQHQLQMNTDKLCLLQHQQLFENQESWVGKDTANHSFPKSNHQTMQNGYQQISSLDQQSEHTCQANSADTGQSEVVSNDDSSVPTQAKDVQMRLHEIKKRQWLLMLFWHVSRCKNSGQCSVAHCASGCEMMRHVTTCQSHPCSNPRCALSRSLLIHHNKCRDSKCVVCGPVRVRVARSKTYKNQAKQTLAEMVRGVALNEVDSPPIKRAKIEAVSLCEPQTTSPQQELQLINSSQMQDKRTRIEVVAPCELQATLQQQEHKLTNTSQMQDKQTRYEAVAPHEPKSTLQQQELQLTNSPQIEDQVMHHDTLSMGINGPSEKNLREMKCGAESPLRKVESPTESSVSAGLGSLVTKTETEKLGNDPSDVETRQDAAASQSVITPTKALSEITKSVKKKISGITYIESLTPEQIRQHIASLRKWIGQSKGKAEKNQAMEHQMSSNACSACAVELLTFDPIPIFCTQCGCRIKRNAVYYTSGTGDNSINYCGPCYSRFDVLENDGVKVQKSSLEKKKNDEHRAEGWVECDKCKKWQHQICVLFNARTNKERSEYICPECCIAEIERGERVPRPANSVLGAKDLPRTMLSDFVEERLSWKLQLERVERSKASGKRLEETPTADGLVVRVISSVDKKLEIKPRFLELFQQEYPKEMQYKSKMLMLFQKIEGVEVCLFGMYVQEFGADSPQPNHRHVYLSYLDSVKYFRPDVKAVTGEALRTYVYHEILIAYLDYCKKRGFSSCYIWACPPLKGDDYILYCHPEIQKTPKTDKLREWYVNMIAKAKKENIVTGSKNLYDYFFTTSAECKAQVTATRLPYFDGDYLPGAAEDILQQIQEEEEGLHTLRKCKTKKVATKRTTKTSAQADIGGSMSKDLQLMQKLGQSISAMKEDFIMVHMHHSCSRCRNFIISDYRWFCQQCGDNFQLCCRCFEDHQKLSDDERHPFGKKECHVLIAEEVQDIPADTVDKDEIMESEFFDNRQAFLSLCQGNQYQYDTLRRAKHSSMMILYHLHNPSAPAFVSSCTICHTELDAGQGWKCKTCPDYDICASCFSSEEAQRHPHKFVARTITADPTTENAKQRMHQLRIMLDVLVHASKCRDGACQYEKCRNMKELFRHGFSCTKRASGGCSICKRMWFLLTAHARSCKDTPCSVPRCTDLRKHLRRAQLQQESRRRAAVNEMIRQRAAEAASGQ